MAKKTYHAESRLSHDGVDVLPGETIEMDEGRAASLVEMGVLIDAGAHKKRAKAKEEAATEATDAADPDA
jgi:hypothetical protein